MNNKCYVYYYHIYIYIYIFKFCYNYIILYFIQLITINNIIMNMHFIKTCMTYDININDNINNIDNKNVLLYIK